MKAKRGLLHGCAKEFHSTQRVPSVPFTRCHPPPFSSRPLSLLWGDDYSSSSSHGIGSNSILLGAAAAGAAEGRTADGAADVDAAFGEAKASNSSSRKSRPFDTSLPFEAAVAVAVVGAGGGTAGAGEASAAALARAAPPTTTNSPSLLWPVASSADTSTALFVARLSA